MIKAIIINILLLLALHIFYIGLYFGFGYIIPEMGSGKAGSISYVIITLLHLYINYLLLRKWDICSWKNLIIFSTIIIAVYIGKLFLP